MRKIALAFLCSTMPLSAAIFYEIDTTRPLCCSLSNKHHNRILVEQGRVKKIIFPEEKLFVRMEEVSGQVFVQLKYPTADPTLISVVTQEGFVQDIEILFSDCPSQVIVLKNRIEQGLQELCEAIRDETPSINASLNCLLKGEMPKGYDSIPFQRCTLRPKFGISASLVGKLKGCTDVLCLYEVSNTTFCCRKILEKEIACRGSLWAFLEKNCLCPKEKILAIVAVPL
jgi:hypothetical protein